MAQHDYVIANGTGAAVRSDLNNALAAIVSNNSGATEPATMYAYQWWADTTTGLLKLRNAANNAWITLRELDGTLTIEDGTASSPGLAFADDLNTGIYSPSADQLGITTGGTVRLTTTTTGITSALPVDVPLGTASAPTVTFTGDLDTGIYSPGANQVAISTNGTGRLFVDSSGRVLAGTSTARGNFSNSTDSPLLQIESSDGFGWSVVRNSNSSGGCYVYLAKSRGTGNTVVQSGDIVGGINFEGNDGSEFVTSAQIRVEIDNTPGANDMPGRIVLSTTKDGQSSPTEAMRIDSQQRVGIGTTPNTLLDVKAGTNQHLNVWNSGLFATGITVGSANDAFSAFTPIEFRASEFAWHNGTTQRAAIDSSGRLLVGTSSVSVVTDGNVSPRLELEGTDGAGTATFAVIRNSNDGGGCGLVLAKSRGTSSGSNTVVASGDTIGEIRFEAADGTQKRVAAAIYSQIDATPGTNDMPGRLVFSTTADGASSPTERMRITSGGEVYTSHPTSSATTAVFYCTSNWSSTGQVQFQVLSNGNVQNRNNSYAAISDIKLKENCSDASSQWSDIKSLRVRKYSLKGDPAVTQIGLIAQEVELVSPGLVTESPDRDADGNDLGTVTKGVKYSVLYMKAVKALQEAMERIEQLEAKVAALESA